MWNWKPVSRHEKTSSTLGAQARAMVETLEQRQLMSAAPLHAPSHAAANAHRNTPVTASLAAAPSLSSTGVSVEDVTIEYSSTKKINTSTISAGNIAVDNGLNVTSVRFAKSNGGKTVTAVYSIAAPYGAFRPGDDGTYGIYVQPNSVRDWSRRPVASGLVGSFQVNVADTTPPVIASVSAPVVTSNGSTEKLTVQFHDDTAIDPNSINAANLSVDNGSTVIGVSTSGTGGTIAATYEIAGPSGGFSINDNGAYNVYLNANSVTDISGNALVASAAPLAQFTVNIGGAPATTPAHLPPGIAPSPADDLQNAGGHTIADLSFANFYVAGASFSSSDVQNIDHALSAALSDPNLNSVVQQYYTSPITSTFRGSTLLPGAAPRQIGEAALKGLIKSLYGQGQLANFDLSSTVFNFLLPPGTELVLGKDTSFNGLGGFHGSVHIGSDTVYFSTAVYSEGNNGITVFNDPWKNVTATLYHELNEARTDPDVEDNKLGFYSPTLGEIADGPTDIAVSSGVPFTSVFSEVPLADGSGTVPIQYLWSNQLHGPADLSADVSANIA